jgi:molybdenum cofactor biosynthesis enzyme
MPEQTDRLTHLDDAGQAHIVDVTDKAYLSGGHGRVVRPDAIATLEAIMDGAMPKGDVHGSCAHCRVFSGQEVRRSDPAVPSTALVFGEG